MKGQGSVAIVAIVVVLVILIGVGIAYRDRWLPPVFIEEKTIVDKTPTVVNQPIIQRDTIRERDTSRDIIVINNTERQNTIIEKSSNMS